MLPDPQFPTPSETYKIMWDELMLFLNYHRNLPYSKRNFNPEEKKMIFGTIEPSQIEHLLDKIITCVEGDN